MGKKVKRVVRIERNYRNGIPALTIRPKDGGLDKAFFLTDEKTQTIVCNIINELASKQDFDVELDFQPFLDEFQSVTSFESIERYIRKNKLSENEVKEARERQNIMYKNVESTDYIKMMDSYKKHKCEPNEENFCKICLIDLDEVDKKWKK